MIYLIIFIIGSALYLYCFNRLIIFHELCHALTIKHYKKDERLIITYKKTVLFEKRLIESAKKRYGITFISDPIFLAKKKCNGYTRIEGSTFRETFSDRQIRFIALAGVIESFFRRGLLLYVLILLYLLGLSSLLSVNPPIYIFIAPLIAIIGWLLYNYLKNKTSDLSLVFHPERCTD